MDREPEQAPGQDDRPAQQPQGLPAAAEQVGPDGSAEVALGRWGRLEEIQGTLASILEQSREGALLTEGASIVLTGKPNAGKSSLMNAVQPELDLRVSEITEALRRANPEVATDAPPTHAVSRRTARAMLATSSGTEHISTTR